MSDLTRTTLIECPRSQSDEAQGNNNSNPSQWSNKVGSGLHLKPGDKISVHSTYISEIGAQAGQIQINGNSLNASVEVEVTSTQNSLFVDSLPTKYTLVNSSNIKKSVEIRDDTFNLVVSPYKCANGEYYAHLPRKWIGNASTLFWRTYASRDNLTINGDAGQTANAPYELNRCSADINIKYWPYRTGIAHGRHRIDGINDGSRYTIFTRKQTFYGAPAQVIVTVEGQVHVGSDTIELKHGSTTAELLLGMHLISNPPQYPFHIGSPKPEIIEIIDETTVKLSTVATLTTNTHNSFLFELPPTSTDRYLPPTTLNSSFTSDECEGFRDPALWGDYIQVKDLLSVKANPGYNSPTDLADQLTQELNERTDIQKYEYPTQNAFGTLKRKEAFTFKTETPSYKVYNCATNTNYSKGFQAEWNLVNGTWNVDHAYKYLSSYQNIGIKRPELYTSGLLVNGENASWMDGVVGGRNGLSTSQFTPMGKGESVFVSEVEWTKENLLRFRDFFDTQATYPELFDYTQNDIPCDINSTRFFHMNLYDTYNGSVTIPGTEVYRNWNFGSNIKSLKTPAFGYDLYDASISASQTSYPIFVDYNPRLSELTEKEVGYTDRGDSYFNGSLEPSYEDLAYGFGRKVRIVAPLSGHVTYHIGFQFSRTGSKIPDHFFHTNASAEVGDPTEVLGAGGRVFGFDYHFTAYGSAAMILYNGNCNDLGSSFASNMNTVLWNKTYNFSQSTTGKTYNLEPYQFGMYLGAQQPIINYNQDQQRFQVNSLHTPEVIGNLFDANYTRPPSQTSSPDNPNAGDSCYKINKRMLLWNYSPEMIPYDDNFSGAQTGASSNAYISHNVGIEPWSIMDAQSGLFIEDWIVPENLWDQSLVGIMGFRYNQFHNPNTTSSRQIRLKSHGANADLNNVNVLTTNAIVSEADIMGFQQNSIASTQFSPVIPTALTPAGAGFTPLGRYITPAITISPVSSVNITAERLPTKTLKPYYTIRSDIISEPNQVLGGLGSGITMPIVSITNKANPYGDFINGFQGQMTFTNTIDRVITRIRCSIHEPGGESARCDLNSAIIFRIDQDVPAQLDIVSNLLQSKKKQDQEQAQLLQDPYQGLENIKFTKDLFE